MKRAGFIGVLMLLWGMSGLLAQSLPLPPRPATALSGRALIQEFQPLDRSQREARIIQEVSQGNVPDFLRKLSPVTVKNAGAATSVTFYVTPDYLALGSDDDYFLTPLTPASAQKIADLFRCLLPTPKMADKIYDAAAVQLPPTPIPPTTAMITVPVFAQHNAMVRTQRVAQLTNKPLGALVAGHKKDVVISARLANSPGKVAIYGWHRGNGLPIQPLYLGHTNSWVDYSHGIRLVGLDATLDGKPKPVAEILADPKLCHLLSDEGVVTSPRYSASYVVPPLQPSAHFGEQTATFTWEPQARFHINAPSQVSMASGKPLKLVFYALPNGNTIEQTIGKKLNPGEDWHFNIQHVGAQMRFVRELCPDSNWVIVYLEAAGKSWPTWRKQNDSALFPQWIETIKRSFNTTNVTVILSGHSGGGSTIFGYLNSVNDIPADVERITFLDSNYAYDENAGHTEKLTRWLKASERHCLCVLAYHDDIALLNGKTFVSASGGTWGRSHLMKKNFSFPFTESPSPEMNTYTALDGRVKFLLRENPEKAVLHTVQVERNGFIQSMTSGTAHEGKGYTYFGPRAYTKWIQE
jgi:hypothetical protein